MKALVWTAADKSEIQDISKPEIADDEVLLKVKATGVCGTDLTIYKGYFPAHRAIPPMALGHEMSGEVAETGSAVEGYRKGDRVVADPLISCGHCYNCMRGLRHICTSLALFGVDSHGSFAEYVKVKADKLYPIPEGLSYKQAAVFEPLAVAVHAVRRSRLATGDTVLVVGGGPIGILIAITAQSAGARQVIVSEIQEFRLNILRELGFTVVNPMETGLEEITRNHFEGIGPEVVFEVTGTAGGFQQAIDIASYRGRIIEVGVPKGEQKMDIRKGNFGELEIIGSRVYEPVDIKTALKMLSEGRFDWDKLIKTFPLDAGPSVLKELSSGKSTVMKAIFTLD
ncbi:MAG: alcohol dehydrogenase catalytic domain-containing protein [Spirochaetales bacterium]|nr:alcohol dehydrogenase catalytic domain-containing protein [Spirochaetales bacterium]